MNLYGFVGNNGIDWIDLIGAERWKKISEEMFSGVMTFLRSKKQYSSTRHDVDDCCVEIDWENERFFFETEMFKIITEMDLDDRDRISDEIDDLNDALLRTRLAVSQFQVQIAIGAGAGLVPGMGVIGLGYASFFSVAAVLADLEADEMEDELDDLLDEEPATRERREDLAPMESSVETPWAFKGMRILGPGPCDNYGSGSGETVIP